ncbi:PREDICTED: uncharacterized protein LOC108358027 isoform X2 [Rhagoletis zephyria]|uniref:uncharacterized protein LOC108358027 isoform X1 n=1 Tax=Rhagoletis zephyria TaxID=28612 RepID=UPI000811512F|nr:PREDICTED: uncharacterized protein LOC108358027 isoform X1 [Rhagoletis zephyria]XP_017464638.1 PREDICTED: uncharacterized protein LOC108358027 isoform X2 [Rhagoletis zephyria]
MNELEICERAYRELKANEVLTSQGRLHQMIHYCYRTARLKLKPESASRQADLIGKFQSKIRELRMSSPNTGIPTCDPQLSLNSTFHGFENERGMMSSTQNTVPSQYLPLTIPDSIPNQNIPTSVQATEPRYTLTTSTVNSNAQPAVLNSVSGGTEPTPSLHQLSVMVSELLRAQTQMQQQMIRDRIQLQTQIPDVRDMNQTMPTTWIPPSVDPLHGSLGGPSTSQTQTINTYRGLRTSHIQEPINQPFHLYPKYSLSGPPQSRLNQATIFDETGQADAMDRKFRTLPSWMGRAQFDGVHVNEKFLSVEDYLAIIGSFRYKIGVPDHELVTRLVPTLTGAARQWYFTELRNYRDYQDFCTKLRARFLNKHPRAQVIMSYAQIKFDPRSQTLLKHIDDLTFQLQGNSCGLDERDHFDIIIGTLSDHLRELDPPDDSSHSEYTASFPGSDSDDRECAYLNKQKKPIKVSQKHRYSKPRIIKMTKIQRGMIRK